MVQSKTRGRKGPKPTRTARQAAPSKRGRKSTAQRGAATTKAQLKKVKKQAGREPTSAPS